MSPSATEWLTDVFLIGFGQNGALWHRGRRYLLVDTFIIDFGLFMAFDDTKKNTEHHHLRFDHQKSRIKKHKRKQTNKFRLIYDQLRIKESADFCVENRNGVVSSLERFGFSC